MADELNSFFAGIGPELASKIPDYLIQQDYTFNENRPQFEFTLVDEAEVAKLLKQIPDSKSTGLD